MKLFRFWCQKVLPLVYDDSLSYYEVLCKVVVYINELIEQDKVFADDIDELKREMNIVQEWIAQFNYNKIEKLVRKELEKYIATMIFVEINSDGYIVYNIPERWKEIVFQTTGVDTEIPDVDYGTLVLCY